ncbi:MAG: hypothetical protein JWO63_748 [Frankiales bacterium]|jgi:hypothetical protein|nr:hypothetical protein [Frankiales bacterium]
MTEQPAPERISTTRNIKAPAAQIFGVVSSPQGHVQIDGSGMLIAAPDSKPVTAVGDTFAMHMDRRPLGDIPDMAEYDVTVVITDFEENALLEWSVMTPKGRPYGHVYGYRLEPAGDGETLVTSYCDWSGIPEHRKDPARWPVVPLSMLEQSLAKLDGVVSAG